MTDWLHHWYSAIPTIDVGMWSLLGLFLLALDTRLQQRGVWRWLGTKWQTVRAWMIAKALALRSMVAAFGREVRDFWRWMTQPPKAEQWNILRPGPPARNCTACGDSGGCAICVPAAFLPPQPIGKRRKPRPKKSK